MKHLLSAALLMLIPAGAALAECAALLDHSYRPLAGKQPVHLCEAYAGKVLLVVNTASKCGFTPQYEGLEALHQELAPRGFAVIGFPSNDFMGQEPGSEEEIRDFCTNTYGVKFPMFEKVAVTGDAATPFYQVLTRESGEAPGWNFHKYLIDRNGKLIGSFGSRTKPGDPALRDKIEAALAADSGTTAGSR